MEIETLKRSHLKRNIIIGILVIAIISAVILTFTRAKYRVTESIPLVNGTIKYSLPDLNIVGLYIDGVEATELDSSKTYTLDTVQSTCTYKDGSTIDNLNISYDSETGNLTITPFTNKGTKCTLYFEEYNPTVGDTILANYPTQLTRNDFSTTVTNTTTGTIYYADTSKGRTYYFAGNPTDNWVQFGGFSWRIIRINEDGTLRLIYHGTSVNIVAESTQIGISAFNSIVYDNMYVGYMYTSGQVHGYGTDSTIKGVLDTWYRNNLASYASSIDGNMGFCGDRTPSTSSTSSNGSGGIGTTTTYYGGYIRLTKSNNVNPTFNCSDEDLYTTSGSSQGNKALQYPIGLITADEVVYAGLAWNLSNSSNYLYTNTSQNYWTMSPSHYSGGAYVFVVGADGGLYDILLINTNGVRPVINLKANVTISSGNGTSSNPYVIS